MPFLSKSQVGFCAEMGRLIVKFIRKRKGPRIATDATWDGEQASYVASSLSHLVCLLHTPVLHIIACNELCYSILLSSFCGIYALG